MGGFGCASMKSMIVNPPSLNSLYVASILKKDNEVKYIDCAALDLDKDQLMNKIKECGPELIIVSVGSATYDYDLKVISEIKDIGGVCIIIGPQGAASPEYALKNSKVDIVVLGEPELIISDIVEKVKKKESYSEIEGIAYRKEGEVIKNKAREHIKELDKLPYPSWELLPFEKYSYQNPKDRPHLAILSSRGCPFSCIYCPYPVTQGTNLRLRGAEEVVNEIKYLVEKFDLKSLMFRDPCLTASKEHMIKICQLIIEKGIKIKWWCETATSTVDDGLLKMMHESGCRGINFGVESGNLDFSSEYAKKTGGMEKAIGAFNLCRKYEIETTAFFILGLPGETEETIKDTINFAIKLEPDYVDFHCASPYPGTKLYDIMREKGEIKEEFHKDLTGHTAFSSTEHISKDRLREFVGIAYQRFYRRPSRVLYELRNRPLWFLQRIMGYFKFKKIN
jgi:radical SAM superfamily enzyme YgiQ (UPF0313 family)